MDAAGRLIMSNYRAENLFGFSARQAGQPIADLDRASSPLKLPPLIDQVIRARRTIWVREVEWARPGVATLEELETMNEELQSMNDELGGSNNELRDRARQVDQLNAFMESVLASLTVGVAVVDRDLKVSAWNAPAHELWGLRPGGGRSPPARPGHSLPLAQVTTPLDAVLAGRSDERSAVLIEAVNRRGRPVAVQVTLSPLVHDSDPTHADGEPRTTGAILVMDEITEGS
ncbi:MAG: PAS domain-containing protein [Actinomycetota bacterium]|nr:PAS domain-containing protein [Actinomycetota bacterium]